MRLLISVALVVLIVGPCAAQTKPKPADHPARVTPTNPQTQILDGLGEVAGLLMASDEYISPPSAGADTHPCSDPKLILISMKIQSLASVLEEVVDASFRTFAGRRIFTHYLGLAEISRRRGCIYAQRDAFLDIMTELPGSEFAGYHERARVGVEDIRAAIGGKPIEQQPWPIGPYVK